MPIAIWLGIASCDNDPSTGPQVPSGSGLWSYLYTVTNSARTASCTVSGWMMLSDNQPTYGYMSEAGSCTSGQQTTDEQAILGLRVARVGSQVMFADSSGTCMHTVSVVATRMSGQRSCAATNGGDAMTGPWQGFQSDFRGELSPIDCANESSLRSAAPHSATMVRIDNKSSQALQVVWIDVNGQRSPRGAIAANASMLLGTAQGSFHMLTDQTGRCLHIYRATDTPNIVTFSG
jgi:hypothetical protein